MYQLNAINRTTGATEIEAYATFETYAEAKDFANRHEMEARSCGWTWVVCPI